MYSIVAPNKLVQEHVSLYQVLLHSYNLLYTSKVSAVINLFMHGLLGTVPKLIIFSQQWVIQVVFSHYNDTKAHITAWSSSKYKIRISTAIERSKSLKAEYINHVLHA